MSERAREIQLPASKSISNRLLLLSALHPGKLTITNLSQAEDTLYLKEALQGNPSPIYIGEGGTSLRFATTYYASQSKTTEIYGSDRLMRRPHEALFEVLRSLGSEVTSLDNAHGMGYKIKGTNLYDENTGPSMLHVEVDKSSQFITALLLLGSSIKGGIDLRFKQNKLVSKPYVKMTIRLMRQMGLSIEENGDQIIVPRQDLISQSKEVEFDWSSAYSFLGAGILTGEPLLLKGLKSKDIQGDRKLLEMYTQFGASLKFTKDGVLSNRYDVVTPQRIEIDMIDYPDQIMNILVLLSALKCHGCIRGIETLYAKESNRVEALKKNLAQFDVAIQANDSSLTFEAKNFKIPSRVKIDTYNDHRIAMAFAQLFSYTPMTFEQSSCVKKSFPDFWNQWFAAFPSASFELK